MAANIAVVYDACVLYPAPLRDLLVQLATTGFFRAKWTELIHDEWTRNLLIKRPDLNANKLARLRVLMNENVPDSLVTDFEDLIPTLELPDPDDCHVLAAAISATAEIIVTFNLKDFPDAILSRYGIVAQHPDVFVGDLIERYPQQVLQAIDTILDRLKNPPQTFDNHLETLANQGLLTSVAMLRDLRSES
jgi:predicted nucleic acid-binding protein